MTWESVLHVLSLILFSAGTLCLIIAWGKKERTHPVKHQLCPSVSTTSGDLWEMIDVPVHDIFSGLIIDDCDKCGVRRGDSPDKAAISKFNERLLAGASIKEALSDEPDEDTRARKLREKISWMKCVQKGWEFGVPENERDAWLDLVVKAVMEKNS